MDCKGYWLNGGGAPGSTCIPPPALLQTQAKKVKTKSHSTCYIAECGCPPFGADKPSWCGSGGAGVHGDWCQESEERCTSSKCDYGYWYAGSGAPGSECIAPAAQGLVQAKTEKISAKSHSTCYIAECGCPPFGADKPSWCGSGGAGVHGDWCQESEERCTSSKCDYGYWYAGSGAPGSECIAPAAQGLVQAKTE